MQTVLDKVTKENIVLEPFPHVVIENALDQELCDRLIAEYPSVDDLLSSVTQSNARFNISPKEVINSDKISDLWKEFIAAHTTQDFYDKFTNLFGEYLDRIYPGYVSEHGSFTTYKAGIDSIDDFNEDTDVLLSAYLAGNTPVTGSVTSVKRAHLDNSNKFLTGLLYLRQPNDKSTGGDLQIYKYKTNKKKFYGQRYIKDKYVECVRTIPFQANTLILFPNMIDALHGVTPRGKSDVPRTFMNLVGRAPSNLFSIDDDMESLPVRRLRKVVRKVKDTLGIDSDNKAVKNEDY